MRLKTIVASVVGVWATFFSTAGHAEDNPLSMDAAERHRLVFAYETGSVENRKALRNRFKAVASQSVRVFVKGSLSACADYRENSRERALCKKRYAADWLRRNEDRFDAYDRLFPMMITGKTVAESFLLSGE